MRDRHTAASPNSRLDRTGKLKDEVYRQMFRLEAQRPGAAKDLAVALLRAWIESDSGTKAGVDKEWLRKICPLCIAMIETGMPAGELGEPCSQ
jgi:hypothetical protein